MPDHLNPATKTYGSVLIKSRDLSVDLSSMAEFNGAGIERTVEFDPGTIRLTVPHNLFNRVAAQIEADPDHYSQPTWSRELNPLVDFDRQGAPLCGTAHCIGGWAVTLCGLRLDEDMRVWAGQERISDPVEVVTGKLLNLDPYATALLTAGGWAPEDRDVPTALRRLQRRSWQVGQLTRADIEAVMEGASA